MKNRVIAIFKLTLIISVISSSSNVFAQKKDNIQNISVIAPANVKIDGKLNEWNDNLQAYNKNTLLNYTLSNDDKNIYMAFKSSDFSNNNKIMGGGISFILNANGEKKSKESYSVTYPILTQADIRNALSSGGSQQFTKEQRDSIIETIRGKLIASMKEIKVSGFSGITDTLISRYNDYGIKAASSFDAAGSFIYELAIPLKLLNLSIDKPKEFAYSVSVNGIQPANPGSDNSGANNPAYMAITSPTSFWGKYILAKK
jgi:hypothetical protein